MPHRFTVIGAVVAICLVPPAFSGDIVHDPQLEKILPEEATQIDNIVQLTIAQMKKRYPGANPVRGGVHPKDHGCVMATFKVAESLPEALRVGVFREPGREYQAWIRFSNAAVLPLADSTPSEHGSRGMA